MDFLKQVRDWVRMVFDSTDIQLMMSLKLAPSAPVRPSEGVEAALHGCGRLLAFLNLRKHFLAFLLQYVLTALVVH